MDEAFRRLVIEKLDSGEELPKDWARELFPPEKREYELVYYGKEREEDIIAETMVVPLQAVRSFGSGKTEWQNMLIFGDNLQVMKTLLEQKQAGKLLNSDGSPGVRMVYIDPPFATRRDFSGSRDQKAYQDKIVGAEFIEFLRKRFIFIREILADDGSVFVHLDQRKNHYLKAILDEVFGEQCFANEIIWRSTNRHNTQTSVGQIHQVILYYRNDNAVFEPIRLQPFKEHVISNYRHKDERGYHSRCDLTGPGIRTGDSGKPWKGYNPTARGRHWQPPSALYDQLDEDISNLDMIGRLDYFFEKGFVYLPGVAGGQPRGKLYLNPDSGNLLQDIWAYQPYTSGIYADSDDCIDQDVQWLQNPEGDVDYPTQKPEGVLSRIIRMSTKSGDLVLDAFAGSGTTCAVAEKLQRRWIAIDCGKLALYTIQKRMLNLKTEIGNKGKRLKPQPFTLYNGGLYDFTRLKKSSWDVWRFYALELFQCKDEPHVVGGIQLDGYYGADDVLVFNHTTGGGVVLDYGFIDDLDSQIGSRLGKRFFIVAPAASVTFLEDYIERGKTKYYILRIPYSIIDELHKRDFEAITQPTDEAQVNDTVEAVGFDFIRPPKVECKYILSDKTKLKEQEAVIKIKTFINKAMSKGASQIPNLEALAMVLVDYDYPYDRTRKGKESPQPFQLDEVLNLDARRAAAEVIHA
jgi:16S rRNA G966 N2-methylase RsmD